MDKIQIWDMLLGFVPGKSATVAGGAVRDYLNGRDAKDIDVFININDDNPYRYDISRNHNVEMLRRNNIPAAVNPEYHIDGLGNGVQLIDNFHMFTPDNPDEAVAVQFIYVNGSVREYILKKFDLDFCQAWYRKGIISTTAAYNYAVENNVITNINGFAGDRTRAHANRIIDRVYNGWVYNEEAPAEIAVPVRVQVDGWDGPLGAAPVARDAEVMLKAMKVHLARANPQAQPPGIPWQQFVLNGANGQQVFVDDAN